MLRRNLPSARPERAVAAIVFLLAAGPALAATPVGSITHLSGTLSVNRADGSTKVLSTRSEVLEGDTLATAQDTYARMKFSDGAEVVLRPETRFKIETYRYDEGKPESDSVILGLLKGGLRSVTGLLGLRNKNRFSLQTSTATIGIRGTHFGALICNADCQNIPTVSGQPPADGLHVDVASGAVAITNPAGSQVLNAGQFGFVGGTHVPPVEVPAAQGIRVTMPTAISNNASGGHSVTARGDASCSF